MTGRGKGKGRVSVSGFQFLVSSFQSEGPGSSTGGWAGDKRHGGVWVRSIVGKKILMKVCTLLVAVTSLTLDRRWAWGSESCSEKIRARRFPHDENFLCYYAGLSGLKFSFTRATARDTSRAFRSTLRVPSASR